MKQKSVMGGLDIAKFLGALLIVSIHTRPLLVCGKEMDYYSSDVFCRIAVAFFFMCSGYFTFTKIQYDNNGKIENSNKNRKQLIKSEIRIITLYIMWSIIYFIVELLQWMSVKEISFIHFLIAFGISFFIYGSYYHFWYMLALIYGIPIIYYLSLKINKKKLLIIGSGLYLVHLIINWNSVCPESKIISLISRINIFPGALSSTIFIGIPFMIWGGCFQVFQHKSKKVWLFFSIIGLYLEARVLLHRFNITSLNYIIFTVCVTVLIFQVFYEMKLSDNQYKWFRNLSTVIYCIHPLWITLLKKNGMANDTILLFITTIILSFLSSVALILLSKKFVFIKNTY